MHEKLPKKAPIWRAQVHEGKQEYSMALACAQQVLGRTKRSLVTWQCVQRCVAALGHAALAQQLGQFCVAMYGLSLCAGGAPSPALGPAHCAAADALEGGQPGTREPVLQAPTDVGVSYAVVCEALRTALPDLWGLSVGVEAQDNAPDSDGEELPDAKF